MEEQAHRIASMIFLSAAAILTYWIILTMGLRITGTECHSISVPHNMAD